MKETLYLDLETVPGPESGKDSVVVKAPANYKDPAKIKAYQDANKEAAYLKQSFNGGYGSICSFSFALGDGEISNHHAPTRESEADMLSLTLREITEMLTIAGDPAPFLCGHYISGFDLRLIMHRCIVLGVKIPPWLKTNAKPWDERIRDTMTLWAGARDTIGLDELCGILGIAGKDGFDGSMVYEAWLDGEHEKISAYCNSDVEKVRKINKMFLEVGL